MPRVRDQELFCAVDEHFVVRNRRLVKAITKNLQKMTSFRDPEPGLFDGIEPLQNIELIIFFREKKITTERLMLGGWAGAPSLELFDPL